ncbi:molybdate ABC transporter substrate-binding protein [Muriicola sp. E247]|uniref:molybdate ABC transporter substrate-binding protein n=1 Tax=Muriicola sp. E247 TaxID=3242730 RepID=UPI0035247D62
MNSCFKLRFRLFKAILFPVILIFILGCKGVKEGDTIRIAVASNLHYAIDSIVENFENKHGISCEVILGSSGKLYAQIMEGAPYDLFLSADMKYPESLSREGKTLDLEVFAYGSLVLWTANPAIKPSIEILQNEGIKHLALPNPKIAPFGAAALQVLNHYGINDKVSSKLVYGESVAQANQFILSGAAEMGFTSLAVVKSPELSKVGQWILIDADAYEKLPHVIALINPQNSSEEGSRKFFEYLFSEEGQAILKNFGYSVRE